VHLDGTAAIVTGASRGIGRAIAIELARRGARVACLARTSRSGGGGKLPGSLEETVATIEREGGSAHAVATDLSELDSLPDVVRRCREELGAIDILVNNAAVAFAGGFELSFHRYELMERVNALAPWVLMREVLPDMRRRRCGAILNVSSAAALAPFSGLMAYGMTKLSMERLSIDVAVQVQDDGVDVNVFRVDVPVDSEGVVFRRGAATSDAEPPEVAALGAAWVLERDRGVTGRTFGMDHLRSDLGVIPTRAERTYEGYVPEALDPGPFLRPTAPN
jgi:citronellol/citronellal dehydrogenase